MELPGTAEGYGGIAEDDGNRRGIGNDAPRGSRSGTPRTVPVGTAAAQGFRMRNQVRDIRVERRLSADELDCAATVVSGLLHDSLPVLACHCSEEFSTRRGIRVAVAAHGRLHLDVETILAGRSSPPGEGAPRTS